MSEPLPPCLLCGTDVELHYSTGSGIGGQAFTTTKIAECPRCATVYRAGAASTAGFTRREAEREWRDFHRAMTELARDPGWRPIESAPTDGQMYIWARPKGGGKWGLGLAYRTVSGTSRDAYGDPGIAEATYWMPLPGPPPGQPERVLLGEG